MKDLTLLLMILIFLPQSLQLRNQSNIRVGNKKGQVERGSSTTNNNEIFNIGIIAPHTNFGRREYLRAINSAIGTLQKTLTKGNISMFTTNNTKIHFDMMSLTPSPTSECHTFMGTRTEVGPVLFNIQLFSFSTAILNVMCKDFLQANVSAIVYLMNNEKYGRSTASAQYFLQLAGYLGIPVISWNADNSGLGTSIQIVCRKPY